MRNTIKPLLRSGVAVAAVAAGTVAAYAASAQCATSASTVNCSGAATDTQAQQAIDVATPPNLTFIVNQNATIASVQRQILIQNSARPIFVPPNSVVTAPGFTGVVAVTNAGVIGSSPTLTTDLLIAGGSRFTGVNSGVINGSVIVGSSFGGAPVAGSGSFANTGTVTGTVSLQGSADQSYTGNGAIQGGSFGFTGLSLLSRAAATITAADGTRSTTVTGGTASATIDGVLRSTGAQPAFRGVSAVGIGGATVTIGGTTGGVTVRSLDANTTSRFAFAFENGNFSFTSSESSQAVGGAATLVVNPAGTVNGFSSVTGLTSATATLNGAVLAGGQDFGPLVSVTANATDSTFSQSQSQSGSGSTFASDFQSASSTTSRGGAASVTVGAGATVAGGVSVTGGSTADATVNGAVGAASSFFVSGLSVTAGAADSVSESTGRSDATGGTSSGSGRTTQRNGAASATVGATGTVLGGVQVTGISNASAAIAGTVGSAQTAAGVSVVAQGSDSTFSSSGSSSSATGSNTNSSIETFTSRAGTASASVAATGRVFGSVGVSGGTGATATVDGAVGSASNSFGGVFVSTGGSDGTSMRTSTFTAGNGFTQVQESSFTARGGAATVTIGATGSVIGSVSASSTRGAATATLAGRAGVENPQNFSPARSLSAVASGTDTRSTSTSAPDRNAFSNSTNAVGGQATATVLAGGVMSGDVVAVGDAGATLVNAGIVVRALRMTAGAANTTNSGESTASTAMTSGMTTFTNRFVSASTSVPVAADGTVTNNGMAGSVAATATGNLTFRNDGIVAGNVALASVTSSSTFDSSDQRVTTSAPAGGGGATTVTTNTTTSNGTSQAVGGNVVGTYNGTAGTDPADPQRTQPTQITQIAVGSSTATIGGLVLGTVTSATGGVNSTNSNSAVTTTTTQPLAGFGTPAATETTVVANRSSRTVVGGPSSVTVSGAVRNDGTGTSGVIARAATGSASATVGGGVIQGGLVVAAGQGQNVTASFDQTATSTRAASTGFFSPFVQQSATDASSTVIRLAGGTATATLTGATVGSVQVSGVGTAAGSTAATASVDAASTVGAFTVTAGGSDRRDDQTDTLAGSTRTIVTTRMDTVSVLAGNARADVAGRIGGAAAVSSQGGAATFNLTGVAADMVSVAANAFDRTTTSTQTFAIANPQGFPISRQTGQTTTSTTTARGGVATLAVASTAALQGAGTNAAHGAVDVDGFGGSVLTVAAGSRLLTNGSGTIRVGGTGVNATAATTFGFDPATGAFTGSTTRQTITTAAGAASIGNAGVIGASTAFLSAPVAVRVESVGGATISNAGQINGNIAATGLGERRDITRVLTPASATAPLTIVATTTFTPIAATAGIANTGVVSGRAEVVGGTGSIRNTGVIRGGAQLGAGVRNYTNTTTSTIVFQPDGTVVTTNVTSATTPPATLFAQALTLDQNGLVLGGVRVEGATTADPATGAAIRTSTITAAVNLNQGSVTLGDVTAQQDASGRLTRTTVNLTGDGFLGAGPNLQAAPSSSAVRFTTAPNYQAFAAIDPALGATGAAGFTPAVALASGSRISGVEAVTKSGSGVFTIVGAPLLRGTAPNFTIDAPLVRVASGELQLGVAGVDPATGQGVFGVRGAVQNDGVLVVGRRITDGTLSGVQGVTLSVAGNLTQGSGGTLVLAAAPQPALRTEPALATTPSFLNVDGALSLAGTVSVAAPQGIYVSGRGPDIASVGGAFSSTATVNAFSSPFVAFGLATRTEGGRTLVSINVTRTPFASVATNGNAAAAGGALQAAIPAAVAAGASSDIAGVILGLDTGTAARAAGVLDDLGQASFYGSLATVSITRPFGEVGDALAGIDTDPERPVSLWLRTGGNVTRTRGDAATGARQLNANNVGAIVGLAVTSGGVSAGLGVGPGWTDANAGIARARANGWMVGAYAAGRRGPVSLAGQAVAGWSEWTASRDLQVSGRYATTRFDSREIRLNGRASLDLTLGSVALSPFAGLEWRQWRFDGFSERNAGALGVASGRRTASVLAPEAGARVSGTTGALRAFMEGAYVFQQDLDTARAFSLVGVPAGFVAQGVTPDDYGRIGSGLETDIGRGTVFVRGDVWNGGGNRLGAVRLGARVRF